MKKILSTSVLFITLLLPCLYAQEPKAGDYIKFPQHQKFEGTWVMKNESSTIRIVFINKERVQLKDFGIYVDQLEGKLTYVVDNKTILSNESIIKGGISRKEAPNMFNAVFNDPAGQSGKVAFTFENMSNLNMLTAEFIPFPTMGVKDSRPVRMPKKVVLTRVKE